MPQAKTGATPPLLPAFGEKVEPQRFGFLLVPNFSLIPFAAATEALRVANWLSGLTLYEWYFLTEDGRSVPAANGLEVAPHAKYDEAPPLNNIIVFAGGRVPPTLREERVLSWMRRQARAGVRIGAAGLGSFILARAGLLNDYRCTVHWKLLPKFRDEFPHLNATDEIYEIDRDRHTSSGGTGTLDVMLALIAGDHGETLASHVAEEFMHDRIRPSSHSQRMPLRFRLNITNRKVLNAVGLMEKSIENPLSCASIAESQGVSVRQLEKLFRAHLDTTPKEYQRQIRLKFARRLLMQTTLSVLEVGMATGFSCQSHFSKAYRAEFGVQPRHDRGKDSLL
ncbi:protein GbdR [Kaistia sp. 32K]|uniref:GlxA family transcriptional regulator n=1 Tax=Kaistia sp. 32K TaxID=2795690 RepID=UPI0019161E4B|nr:GlxA family transcriptional regulator [Kaistia sp. 32K]BCP54012.1 protein GbdR [Kaistia sp. 32K]